MRIVANGTPTDAAVVEEAPIELPPWERVAFVIMFRDGLDVIGSYARRVAADTTQPVDARKEAQAAVDSLGSAWKQVQRALVQFSGEVEASEGMGKVTRDQGEMMSDAAYMMAPIETMLTSGAAGVKVGGKYAARVAKEAATRTASAFKRAPAAVKAVITSIAGKTLLDGRFKTIMRGAMRGAGRGIKWALGAAEGLGIKELLRNTLRWGLFAYLGYRFIGPLSRKAGETLSNLLEPLAKGGGLILAGLAALFFLTRDGRHRATA